MEKWKIPSNENPTEEYSKIFSNYEKNHERFSQRMKYLVEAIGQASKEIKQ